MTMTRCIFQFI